MLKYFGSAIMVIGAVIAYGIVGSLEINRISFADGCMWIFWCLVAMALGYLLKKLGEISRKDWYRLLVAINRRLSK